MEPSSPFAQAIADSQRTSTSAHHLPAFAHGDNDPSFKDILDTINPLQHIPIVATIYRQLTGDEPGSVSRIAGGALYGGPLGLMAEVIDSAIDDTTGKDLGGHVWATLFGDDKSDEAVKTADATPTPSSDAPTQPVAAKSADLAENLLVQAPDSPAPTASAKPVAVTVEPLAATPKAKPQLIAQNTSADMTSTTNANTGKIPMANGFMPVPQRRAIQVVPPVPPTSTISSSNQHSNVPATGHTKADTSLTDTRGIALNQVGSTTTSTQAAVSQPTPTANNAWLPDAMAKALDKYERMNKLGQNPAQTMPPPSAAAQAQSAL